MFQVYSPDELKQAEVIEKIDEDLDGAVSHWQNTLREWIFVYNVRRGIAPDIPRTLQSKQIQYPAIRLDHLSSDGLWEMTRILSLQQRCEVLGAPNGYEHLFFSTSHNTNDLKERLKTDSFVLVQDLIAPISLQAVSEALLPAQPFGAPFFIRPTYDQPPYDDAARQQQLMVQEIMTKARDLIPRFSVFSLAPIPLVIHLGFLLSDRVEVQYFKFDRDRRSWKWLPAEEVKADENIKVEGLPTEATQDEIEIAISVSLSAEISTFDVEEAALDSKIFVKIFVENPDVMWLQSPTQLVKLAQIFRTVLATIRSKVPRCSRILLFYAGATGGCVVIGQQINPRMNPPVELYQYSQQTTPRYTRALTLTEELS